jgi:hypothetical protein
MTTKAEHNDDIPIVTASVIAPADLNGGYQFDADAENGQVVTVQVVRERWCTINGCPRLSNFSHLFHLLYRFCCIASSRCAARPTVYRHYCIATTRTCSAATGYCESTRYSVWTVARWTVRLLRTWLLPSHVLFGNVVYTPCFRSSNDTNKSKCVWQSYLPWTKGMFRIQNYCVCMAGIHDHGHHFYYCYQSYRTCFSIQQ